MVTTHNSFSVEQATLRWCEINKISSWYEPITTSTNQIAKDSTSNYENFKIFLTSHQTQGKGRGSNVWKDLDSKQWLSSWLFSLESAPQPVLAPLIGLTLFESLKLSFPNVPFSLKAPNDVLINGEKLSGILLETVSDGKNFHLVVGIGINVFAAPENINATYLNHHIKVDEEKWFTFLNSLLVNLKLMIGRNARKIDSESCSKIILALNENPLLEEKYISISQDGDLIKKNKTIKWSDL